MAVRAGHLVKTSSCCILVLGFCLAAAVAAQEPTCIDYGEQPQPLSVLPLAGGDAAGISVLGPTAYMAVSITPGWMVLTRML